MGKFIDITGNRYGRLLVLHRTQSNTLKPHWVCKCDCGNMTEVAGASLKNGNTQSCGCYNTDILTKHGDHKTALYKTWCDMKKRCNVPSTKSYSNYGGRGITYTQAWEHYIPFKEWAINAGYQPGLQIDRIDNNRHYFPDNCRWVTPTIQRLN